MASARIELERHIATKLFDRGGQNFRITRLDDRIRAAVEQQQRRRTRAREMERLRQLRIGRARHCGGRRSGRERVKIGGTRKTDHGAQIIRVEPGLGEIVRIKREHQRDMRAGRMADQHHALGVTTDIVNMVLHPAHHRGAILNKTRKMRLGHQPIAWHDHDIALIGKSPRGKAILAASATIPAAAMDENNHRPRSRMRRSRPDIKTLARRRPIVLTFSDQFSGRSAEQLVADVEQFGGGAEVHATNAAREQQHQHQQPQADIFHHKHPLSLERARREAKACRSRTDAPTPARTPALCLIRHQPD